MKLSVSLRKILEPIFMVGCDLTPLNDALMRQAKAQKRATAYPADLRRVNVVLECDGHAVVVHECDVRGALDRLAWVCRTQGALRVESEPMRALKENAA